MKKLSSLFLTIFMLIAVAYSAFIAVLYAGYRNNIYFPTAETNHVTENRIVIDNNGTKLVIWEINPGNTRGLIYFGGNNELVSNQIPFFKNMFPHTTTYLVNYRSYGDSEGNPTEENLFSDALKIYRHSEDKHTEINVMGRSLGTGVATYLAAEKVVNKLVLITPYDSIVNIAENVLAEQFPFYIPVSLLMKDRFESWKRAHKIDEDVLIIMSEKDSIVRHVRTNNLIRYFKEEQITHMTIPRTTHANIMLNPQTGTAIKHYLNPN